MHRSFSRSCFLAVTRACALIVTVLSISSIARADEKIPVRSSDDLPRHTYEIDGLVSEMLQSDEKLVKLAKLIEADIHADLETYDVQDPTTLQGLYGTLMSVRMLEDRLEEALQYIPRMRELEEKEAGKLMMGSMLTAMVAARKEAGSDETRFRKILKELYLKRLRSLPWEIVGDRIEEAKGRTEMRSEKLMMGMIKARLDPIVAQTGTASADIARGIIGMKVALKVHIPLKDDLLEVYSTVIDEHRVAKKDIWEARSVALSAKQNLTPVTVAIWDTGTDTAVFPGQLFVNPNEKLDGTDTDGNGFVDDVHGIGFDLESERTPHLLCSLDELTIDVDTAFKNAKGFSDMQAAIDSPEASAIKKTFATLEQDEVKTFIENLTLYSYHMHGTHVAGIAAEGNPFARILVTRLTADHHLIPQKPTFELAHKGAASNRDAVDYFKKHGVRVVNMSWSGSQAGIESALEANGVGETAEERADIARKMFKIGRDALYTAISEAPNILFITSAGNDDNDVEFDEMIPSAFDLPNLLVVGAVDQAGDPTDFTSFGRTVQIYANGFEVDSYVPGGKRFKASGTSMSSPNAANLAAKMLAVKPTLTPPQVIELMKKGADSKTVGSTTFLLTNPKRTLDLL
ncbi:MAG: S8 family serine peptidase [Phycisphaerales bacterium]|nr:MAG: S8 family serine peptidase [Phycisphaerales bacterium]